MKIMVIGHARHGKDSVCNVLCELYGLKFISSSLFVADKAVRPWLEQRGIVYNSMDDCYADRVNHRADWFDAIAAYNKDDPAKLGKELFAQYDVYCGLRNLREFQALYNAKAFDVCFWVDRSGHVPLEPETSFTIPRKVADYIIDNEGDLCDLRMNVIEAMEWAGECGLIEKVSPNLLHA